MASAMPDFQTTKVVRLDLTTNSGTRSAFLRDDGSVDTLMRALEEASRSSS